MQIQYSIRGHESDEAIDGEATHSAASCRRWMAAHAARGMRVEARDERGRVVGRARRVANGAVSVRVKERAFVDAERAEVARSVAGASWILSAICVLAAVFAV